MVRRAQEFQTIRSEGGLLPPDLLRRVIDSRGSLKGTKPQDYGLPEGERLNEVITQSWSRLRRHWSEFRAAAARLPEGEAGTGLTNDKWSLPLLRELGFGLLPVSISPEIAGRTYAISRFFASVPIHLVGCGLSLDRRAAGVRGAAGGNPHGLVQEVLNRSPDHLWGIVANGLRLRILRDNQALSRQSFLEFDLEAMFNAEAYSDFVLLWLVGHATRLAPRDGNRIETCWLEEWTKEAEEQGTRALKDLRGSVERALQVLGEGFTSHPKNTALREALRSGSLPLTDFHGQLLRVVYRLIFLFVAEDRTLQGQALLHPRDDSDAARIARERYATHYGTARLRELAGKIKGSRHGDVWQQLQLLVGALSGDPAFEATRRSLALPALGSFLWSPGSTAALNNAELSNHDFLEALRHLAFTRQGKMLRPVDYRNLGAEELGGVYESLLALTPQISADGARFSFVEFAGNERKTSGSYYTPDSLVQCLLDSALDPVVEEAVRGKTGAHAEKAILSLKVCDPAVGSGHFLVGAAHRLARHLSRVRAQAQGESEPSPLLYQHALRDVIGRCLYGVDLNQMAAELCRVGLWLEALEPGKPLSFLDHHIRVGNSLLGTTPELISRGLPDEAFNPIQGDDTRICTALKRRNRQEREGGQIDLGLQIVAESSGEYDTLTSISQGIDQATDESIEAIRSKAEQFQRLVVSPEYRHRQQLADAWCAAFVWPKQAATSADAITTDTIRRLETDAGVLSFAQRAELDRLAGQYQFFHWHLAFPEVFAHGGFDCMLGNPPWERVKLQEQEFFGSRSQIATAPNAAARKKLIAKLPEEDPALWAEWCAASRKAEGDGHFLRQSGRYPLCGKGDVNSYAIFAEHNRNVLGRCGRAGFIVPAGLATDDTTKEFFQALVTSRTLHRLFHFENEERVFEGVNNMFRFALITVGGRDSLADEIEIVAFARGVEATTDPTRRYQLSPQEIAVVNPNTRTFPTFVSRRDAEINLALYRRVGVFWFEADGAQGNPWGLRFMAMLHMANDSALFRTRAELEAAGGKLEGNRFSGQPGEHQALIEAKMVHHYEHRYATYDGATQANLNKGTLPETSDGHRRDASFYSMPQYWVARSEVHARLRDRWDRNWLLGWRDITNAHNERTVIASLIPRTAVGHTTPLLMPAVEPPLVACLYACLCSFALDYAARQKVGGTHLTYGYLKQLPVLIPSTYAHEVAWQSDTLLRDWLLPRVLELTYTAWDLEPFARDVGYDGPPFRWDAERRFVLRCELDAAFFHLYGLSREDTDYVMDTFPIVRKNDYYAHGEYRTKRVILEIYGEMQEAARTRQPYQSRLDPPPGLPRDAVGSFIPYAQIADNPPPHIHLPRDAAVDGNIAFQLSDLATRFPTTPFLLRLGASSNVRTLRVRPVKTADISQLVDQVALASPKLRSSGTAVSAAVGRVRLEARTDASDGSAYVLITVRGDDGNAQARFSEEEWRNLTTVGVVDERGED